MKLLPSPSSTKKLVTSVNNIAHGMNIGKVPEECWALYQNLSSLTNLTGWRTVKRDRVYNVAGYEAHSITQRYLLHDKALQDFPVY